MLTERHQEVAGKRRRARSTLIGVLLGLAVLAGAVAPGGGAVPSYAEQLAPQNDETPNANPSTDPGTPADPATGANGDELAQAPDEGGEAALTADPDDQTPAPNGPAPAPQPALLAVEEFCQANQYYALDQVANGRAALRQLTLSANRTSINAANVRIPAGTSYFPLRSTAYSANALGVNKRGVFLFVSQNGTTAAYDIERVELNSLTPSITHAQTRPVSGATLADADGRTVTSGAMDPNSATEAFYYGYFNPNGADTTLRLYRYATDQSPLAKKIADVAITGAGTWGNRNGDLAIDGEGNLLFVVSSNGTGASAGDVITGSVSAADLQRAVVSPVPIQLTSNQSPVRSNAGTGNGYNGIAYGADGNLFVQQVNVNRVTNPVTMGMVAGGTAVTPTSSTTLVDLASCMTPPTLTVKKNVLIDRFDDNDQFTLTAAQGGIAVGSPVTTTGREPGVQSVVHGPDVVHSAQTVVNEAFVPANRAGNYSTDLACRNETTGQTIAVTKTNGNRTGTFTFPPLANTSITDGYNIVCTFENTALKPRLEIEKGSIPVSGTRVNAGDVVSYRLTFDNSRGGLPVQVDHLDHLGDVLDDATFVTGSIRYGDGGETAFPATSITAPGIAAAGPSSGNSPSLAITGSVQAGQTRTVWFQVRVLDNAANAGDRADETAPLGGYLLRNYLTQRGVEPPTECVAPAEGERPLCAEHPIRAWTVTKDSQPGDGASLHTGGNVYYRVSVDNLGRDHLGDVVIEDDLTETLLATTWATAAPNLVPVPHGISLWSGPKGTGQQLKLDGTGQCVPVANNQEYAYDASYVPTPHFVGGGPVDPLNPNTPVSGKWSMRTLPFDVPACAGSAVVGYVVEVGHRADWKNDDATAPLTDSTGADVPAAPNASWVNTAQGRAATVDVDGTPTEVWPNQCSANDHGGTGVPPGWEENGPSGAYGECKTWHQLSESYFHIQKNGMTADGSGGTVWNVQGAEFVIGDTRAQAEAGEWSKWFCRTNNDPTQPGYVPAGSAPAASGAPDWGRGSTTHTNIVQWNSTHPVDQQVPMCGLSYIDTGDDGQPAGTIHIQDLRGGDDTGWRAQGDVDGSYWIVEVRAPNDYQLLSQPMRFWVAPNLPTPEGLRPALDAAWYDYQGRISFPVVGVNETPNPGWGFGGDPRLRTVCTDPRQLPENGQPSCIMPTGWLMQIYDTRLKPLPLTGGGMMRLGLTISSLGVLALGAVAVIVLRRRRLAAAAPAPEQGAERRH